jgi:hypothetical protein
MVDREIHLLHNTLMMKKNAIQLTVPRSRTRAHFVLFCENTPFKQKVVESKRSYRRTPKHRNSAMEG